MRQGFPTTPAQGPAASTPIVETISAAGTITYGPFSPDLFSPIWLTAAGISGSPATGSIQITRAVGGGTQYKPTKDGTVTGLYNFSGSEDVIVNEPILTETVATAGIYVTLTLTSGSITFSLYQ